MFGNLSQFARRIEKEKERKKEKKKKEMGNAKKKDRKREREREVASRLHENDILDLHVPRARGRTGSN